MPTNAHRERIIKAAMLEGNTQESADLIFNRYVLGDEDTIKWVNKLLKEIDPNNAV